MGGGVSLRRIAAALSRIGPQAVTVQINSPGGDMFEGIAIYNLLRAHPRFVALPHLGASTEEAEENCAIMVADQVSDYLDNGNILNSVNFPNISLPRNSEFRLAIACTAAADQSAILAAVESVGSISKTRGDLAFTIIGVLRMGMLLFAQAQG